MITFHGDPTTPTSKNLGVAKPSNIMIDACLRRLRIGPKYK